MLIRAFIVVVAVAVAAVWYLALPPRAPLAAPGDEAAVVRGAFHVHTSRSDGTGSPDTVAAAAARAGLDFVVFTDHGDGTTEPETPRYRSGVLCIDGVEISTQGGHIVALGLPKAPYPLGGEARDVLEDIARMGGMAIAAHPGSLKPELQWSDWALPADGIEWLNADSEWRDETRWSLVRALFTYPARPIAAIAGLLDRPTPVLQRWDEMLRTRRVVAVAAADAHARVGPRTLGEPYDNGVSLHLPAYERIFSVFSNVLPDAVLTGDAAKDAAFVLDAIRNGRLYSRIDAISPSGTLAFESEDEALAVDLTSPPAGARILLMKDGQPAATSTEASLKHPADAAGVYRVEVSLPGAPGEPPVPWIVSNPIYVGRHAGPAPVAVVRPASTYESQYSDGNADRWTVETSPASRGAFEVVKTTAGTQIAFRYALGGTVRDSAYAALAMTAGPSLPAFDRLAFTANADRPMRLSVQLRAPDGEQGERWQQSVFIDDTPRDITVFFDDMRAAGDTRSERAPLDAVDSILFVVDTVNTPLGGSGRVWLDDVKYGR